MSGGCTYIVHQSDEFRSARDKCDLGGSFNNGKAALPAPNTITIKYRFGARAVSGLKWLRLFFV